MRVVHILHRLRDLLACVRTQTNFGSSCPKRDLTCFFVIFFVFIFFFCLFVCSLFVCCGINRYALHCLSIPETHETLFHQLVGVGNTHKQNGFTIDSYNILLQAIDYSLEEYFASQPNSKYSNNKYNLRVKFCLQHIYWVIIDIMTQNDAKTRSIRQQNEIAQQMRFFVEQKTPEFESKDVSKDASKNTLRQKSFQSTFTIGLSLSDEKDWTSDEDEEHEMRSPMFVGQDLDENNNGSGNDNGGPNASESLILRLENVLHSLEDCLSDTQLGFKLFEKFCNEHMCHELILFYKEYINYRNALNQINRNKIGSKIITKFIMDSARMFLF